MRGCRSTGRHTTGVAADTCPRVDQVVAGVAVDQQAAVVQRISTGEKDVNALGIISHQQAAARVFPYDD